LIGGSLQPALDELRDLLNSISKKKDWKKEEAQLQTLTIKLNVRFWNHWIYFL